MYKSNFFTNMNKIRTYSTTEARKKLGELINILKYQGGMFAIGRQNKQEVLVIPFPENHNEELSEITNFSANSASFDFLKDEPDLYSLSDIKKSYV